MRDRRSKGKGRKFGHETARVESPSCSLSNACHAGGPEKVLGLTCVQSQSSHEIRKAQLVISEFSTFLKINKSREHFFTVNSFYPIYG